MKPLTFLFLLPFAFSTLPAEVPLAAEDTNALEAGVSAPNPELTTVEGAKISLKELTGGKPSVLVFYRGGWCPYCNRQLEGLQKTLPKLKEKGWQLIALSPDKPEELKKSVEKQDLAYTLMSDSEMNAAKAFGIAFQVDPPTIEKYKGYKIDLVKASGQPHQQLPVPSVFLIDANGKIIFSYSNPNYKERLSEKALLKALP